MDVASKRTPRLEPLPIDFAPELKEHFEAVAKNLGFVPRKHPDHAAQTQMVKALAQMMAAVWDPDGEVDCGPKRLIAHVASRMAGCQYRMARTIQGAALFGVEDKKLADIWEYQSQSALYGR